MHYLDIETTGLDPSRSKLVTIQYGRMDENTGRPMESLRILREWELGEEGMLRKFQLDTQICSGFVWDFVPIGYNLNFEHRFLGYRSRHYKLPDIRVVQDRPHIDLHHVGILINGGRFKGSGLDDITDKPRDGSFIPFWYEKGMYGKIDEYVRTEFRSFARFASFLFRRMPELGGEFRHGFDG